MNGFFLITDELGGAEQLLLLLAKEDLCSKICIFKSKSTNLWQENGFSPYYCDNNYIRLLKYCRKNKFKRVYSSNLMINSTLGFLRSLGLLKTNELVCRESTSSFSRYKGLKLIKYKVAYRLGYRKIDLLITQSDKMKRELISNIPKLQNRINIKTISNPFQYPKKDVKSHKEEFPYIVSAGRLIPEKGFDILIEVFSKLKQDCENIMLIILGEGEKRKRLEGQIKKMKQHENIKLQGFVTDVYPWFKGAELCVVSSRIEGFPNVLLQMMSQNDKVVSTLCAGGIDELKGVYTSPTDDINGLYMAMKKAITEDTEKNRKIFDEELKSRSIESFIEKVNHYVNG